MKLLFIGLGFGLIGYSFFLSPAIAQCVQGDVPIQSNLSDSHQPTQRTNNATMDSDPKNSGNTSVTRSLQENTGNTNAMEQNREVHQVQPDDQSNRAGINGSTVKVRSQSAVDVYNPSDYYFNP